MKILLQRVKSASVSVDGTRISAINRGVLLFLGITQGDGDKEIHQLLEKVINLRIFEGENGKLDFSLLDIKGEILLVSQFTLYGVCDKGRRPDFGRAAPIDEARRVYELAVEIFAQCGLKVAFGQFQAAMEVELINDGPLTLMLESK